MSPTYVTRATYPTRATCATCLTAVAASLTLLATILLPLSLPADSLLGVNDHLTQYGLEVSGGVFTEVWGNPVGGARQGVVSTNLLHFGMELDLDPLLGWEGATMRNAWFAPFGRDLSADYVGNHFTISNAAAYDSLYLYELWFQQNLFEDRLSLRVGQLAADQEFAKSEYGSHFLNAAFGWPPFLSANLPNIGPAFPKGTPGVRLAMTPVAAVTFQTAIYQGDPFADDVNRHGFRWRLNRDIGFTGLSELQIRWNQEQPESPATKSAEPAKPAALPGDVKLGIWYQSAETSDAWSGSTKTYPHNGGGYLVVEQMTYRKRESQPTAPHPQDASPDHAVPESGAEAGEGPTVGWFGRLAVNPADRNFVDFYFDTGLTCKGPFPGRGEDTAGVALAYGRFSPGARRTLREEDGAAPDGEMVVEVSYQYRATRWLSLQPSIQGIFQPGGSEPAALVLGARASLEF